MIPSDIQLPPRFSDWRPGQFEAAVELAGSPRRFSLLSAPTGSGKSLIYAAIAKLLDTRALVLVGTKALQRQLMSDFEEIGMHEIKGQVNYRCLALDDELAEYGVAGAGCNDGPCHVGVSCSRKRDGGCLYYDAVARASEAELVVTNYAYWLTLGRYTDPDTLGEFGLLICDEAHSAPEWLTRFCTVELDRRVVRKLIGLDLPPIDEGVAVWAEWARGAAMIADERVSALRRELRETSHRRRVTKQLREMTDLYRDLVEMARAGKWRESEGPRVRSRGPGLETDWIAEKTRDGARFSPVWAHDYAESLLFRTIPKIVLCSATLTPTVGKYLGIPPADRQFLESGSGFNPKRRPFIYIPTTRVDHRMMEGQKRIWINRIDAIIDKRLDRRGIIHTKSYARAKDIVRRSRHSDLMITHDNSRGLRTAVARYVNSDPPCILVSPSVDEGFDFPHDTCRYQILSKVPFIDGRSPLVRARSRTDNDYLNWEASLSLVQMVGRGMRAADDLCETFICDDHWKWFRRAGMFPKWFKLAWEQISTVPNAPSVNGIPNKGKDNRPPARAQRSGLAARGGS